MFISRKRFDELENIEARIRQWERRLTVLENRAEELAGLHRGLAQRITEDEARAEGAVRLIKREIVTLKMDIYTPDETEEAEAEAEKLADKKFLQGVWNIISYKG